MNKNHKILEAAYMRYSTKAFDPSKKVSEEDFERLLEVIRMAPSSVNSQPWHFIISRTNEGKARIAKGAMVYNQPKVINASHAIVYCAKTDVDDAYLDRILEQEDHDGRFADVKAKTTVKDTRAMFTKIHTDQLKDVPIWCEKQAYLNMGTLLLAAGAMGVDAIAMEGIDADALNAEFGLSEKGFRAIAIVSLGYRSTDDFNAKLPKSRFQQEEIFTRV